MTGDPRARGFTVAVENRKEESMLSDLDIDRAAQATITRFSDGAGLDAAPRADGLLAEGDMEGRRVCYC